MSKIVIFGGSGLVGSALEQIMPQAYYIKRTMADLTRQAEVESIIKAIRPDVVVHLAAKVGGIESNMRQPADYFYDNIMMNTNIVEACRRNNVERFYGMLSTCIYPADLPEENYPLKEEVVHQGMPELTNSSYAFAKRMMLEHCQAILKQYGKQYSCLIPANLYGINDKYSPEHSHFVAALIRKIHDAKSTGAKKISLMGSGSSLRQFFFAGDLAEIIKRCIEKNITETFNVAPDENLTIQKIARIALKACDASHLDLEWDTTKPNGVYRKDADNSRLKELFPDFAFTPLQEGIKMCYEHYKKVADEINIP